jgi:hypothetical protein
MNDLKVVIAGLPEGVAAAVFDERKAPGEPGRELVNSTANAEGLTIGVVKKGREMRVSKKERLDFHSWLSAGLLLGCRMPERFGECAQQGCEPWPFPRPGLPKGTSS